jgi:hypothetical protein
MAMSTGSGPEDILWERIAKILDEKGLSRRSPPSSSYVLNWTPTYAYSNRNVEAVGQLGVGSCVYEVWESAGDLRTAVYVGESGNLAERLARHGEASEENRCFRGADFSRLLFSYALVPGEISRQAVERALWKLYAYRWNNADGPHGGRVSGQVTIVEHFPEYYTINFNGVRRAMVGVESPVILP